MNNFIKKLINEIIKATQEKVEISGYLLDSSDEERLKGVLIGELSKPSFQQSKTPTQLVNDFLLEIFDINFNLTPASFGEQGHKLIMEWGIQKSSDMNEE